MENNELIPQADVREMVETEINALFKDGTELIITSQPELERSVDLLRSVKAGWSKWDDKRKELVAPHNDYVKAINDFFRAPLQRLKDVEKLVKDSAVSFQAEIERKQREEARIAEEVARKERERIQREADEKLRKEEAARREEAAAREREEKARRDAEDARRRAAEATTAAERKKAEDAARKAEAEQNEARIEAERKAREAAAAAAKAAQKEAAANTVVAAPIQTQSAKVKGFSSRSEFEPEITNAEAAITALVQAGYFHILEINEGKLKKLGNSTNGKPIPGVTWKTATVAATRK